MSTPSSNLSRRQFNKGLLALALGGVALHLRSSELLVSTAQSTSHPLNALGNLVPDPNNMLDLPPGFKYRVLSSLGDVMDDGLTVPDKADGMGCFAIDDDRVALVRNHELSPRKGDVMSSQDTHQLSESQLATVYDTDKAGVPIAGGTSNLIYNLKTQTLEQQNMSLLGTIRNCAGGNTPWGTWLTCEESVDKASNTLNQNHGYVFEVPATATGLVDAKPIKAMGRFNHEAACVDPVSGVVYLTEDRHDSLFYRFIPNSRTNLHAGGKLQALAVKGLPRFDSRNWDGAMMQADTDYQALWIDMDNVTSPNDDLRQRGYEKGAALFARGEGIYYDNGEVYFCCTNGGAAKAGQIMKYIPSPAEGTAAESAEPGRLSLFVESPDKAVFEYGDNIVVAPNGHLVVCEDQSGRNSTNHLKGVSNSGKIYNIARVRWDTEPAGVCFSPDGSTLFVNLYSPTRTLAITGPWERLDSIA